MKRLVRSALPLLLSIAMLAGCSSQSERAVKSAVDKAVDEAVAKALNSTAAAKPDTGGQTSPDPSAGSAGQGGSSSAPNPNPPLPPGQPVSSEEFPFPLIPYGILVRSSVSYKPKKPFANEAEIQSLAFTLRFAKSVREGADFYEQAYKDKGFTIRSRSTSSQENITVTAENASLFYSMNVRKGTENQRTFTIIEMTGQSKTN